VPGPDDGLVTMRGLGAVLLLQIDSPEYGREYWGSDGTPQGTRLLADIRPGPQAPTIRGSVTLRDQYFFVVDDGVHGAEVWRTDGTPEGTEMTGEIIPGPDSGGPLNLVAAGARVYFTAYTPDVGRELWAILAPPGGDLDCDGLVNFFDIDPFLLALLDADGYAQQYPACTRDAADVNADGHVDFFDVDPFVACLFDGCP
jgi:ELWxxDGT repeat protein